jgi:Beta-lactamase.
MVLSHETGFPNWRYETNDVLNFQHEPGTTFGYSGEGFDYLGHFMENKTRILLEDLANRYLFGRILTQDTSYTPRGWWKDRQAKPVEVEDRLRWSAADLLRTTARDYATFIVSILHKQDITEELAQERLKHPAQPHNARGGIRPMRKGEDARPMQRAERIQPRLARRKGQQRHHPRPHWSR